MESYFLSHVHALGGGLVGYVIPFVFVLSLVVFFHELGHFLVARRCGVRIMVFSIGFGPEIVGFDDRYGTRWKISAIPLGGFVKFFGDDNAASVPDAARIATMDAQRARAKLRVSAGVQARRHCRGRAAGKFHLGNRDFCRRLHALRQADDERAGGFRASRTAPLRQQVSSPAISSWRSTATPSTISRKCSASSATSAGETLNITVDRGGVQQVLKATPALKEVKDNFGNVQRIGVLGISRSMAPEDLKLHPVVSAAGDLDGRSGNLVRDRPDPRLTSAASSSAARPPTNSAARSVSRRFPDKLRQFRLCRPHPSCRRPFGLHRAV